MDSLKNSRDKMDMLTVVGLFNSVDNRKKRRLLLYNGNYFNQIRKLKI